jgi:hypothetical protein
VNNVEPSGLKWRPTLFFGVLKWELFRNIPKADVEDPPPALGWVIETKTTTGEITWCAFDNRGESFIKPIVRRGDISDCAHALVDLIGMKVQDHEQDI